MYDFLLRTHTQSAFQEDMHKIFGEVPDTSEMMPDQKEAYLIQSYRSRLKQIAPSRSGVPRAVHVPILYPRKDRMEETGWFESDFQAAFSALSTQGIVKNLDDLTKRRRTKFIRFDTNQNQGERLIRLK